MDIYSLMQTGEPYKSYIKTIPAKLYLTVWDTFNEKPVGIIVEGTEQEDCIVDVWTEKEDVFLKRANKVHLDKGYLVPHSRKVKVEDEPVNVFTDDELDELLNTPFLKLQSAVNKMTSVAPLFRLIRIAKEQEKSEKIIAFLEGKLAEIQSLEYAEVQLDKPEEE